ncbi:MAG: hypothetical protein CVT49_01245 [candidate division Zixibacteria bacterium HGW-Zixibacteria-1]|nr:MAG: hypothetical protein CVT49_01245 [candidate division Zixibacteria bacterium HGW-Zixibacteria-1]
MYKLFSVLQLVRFHNCLLAGAGVWVGGYLTILPDREISLYLASLAVALVCGAGNAFNDYRDIESDRINHPGRPLPSGKLLPSEALLTAGVLAVFSIIISALVGPVLLSVIIALILLLFLYSLKIKKMPFWGNLTVAVAGATSFVVGGIPAGKAALTMFPGVWIPALFALIFHFGREMVKDVADLEGDMKENIRSLPAILSTCAALGIMTFVIFVLIILTIVPLLFNWYNQTYGYIAIFLVDIPLVLIIAFLWVSKRQNRFGRAATLFKLLMLVGLIAFVAGKS